MAVIRILSKDDIKAVFNMSMALEAVEQAYVQKASGQGGLWPMVFHEFERGRADLDIKSGNLDGSGIFGFKLVSWYGGNPDKGLPALYGTSMVFDLTTGAPRALLNGGIITDCRTGAAGALGVKYMACRDAREMLLAGCGALAPFLIAAVLLVRPDLEKVTIINPRHPEKAAALLPEITGKVCGLLEECGAELRAELCAACDMEKAVRENRIIITATPARESFIRNEWVQPGTHFSCIGSDMEGKQEIDTLILGRARVFGDDEKQCLSVGECEKAYKEGVIGGLDGEIGAVISGTAAGRSDKDEITVFDSTGIALQDLACAAAILRKAEEENIGLTAEL